MKKIDLFFNGKYLCSTKQAKTCKEAKEKYINAIKSSTVQTGTYDAILKNTDKLKAFFDKERK